jgi:hypothetical protein
MGRMTMLFSLCLLLSAPAAFPQQSNLQTPEDAYTSRDLIAWSQLQNPQPTPQPLPPGEAPIPQPGQSQDQQAKLPADPHNSKEPAQSYTGEIVRDGNRHLLKTENGITYQLDTDHDLQAFENQTVRVAGNLDLSAQSIQVLKFELFS